MKRLVRATSVALASVSFAAALAVSAPGAAFAAEGCTTTAAKTATSTSLFGRIIELRANGSETCAWGRISNGSIGDQVWVDRSLDGGAHWIQLSVTPITSGRSVFTDSWNDERKVMRACGKAGNRPDIACTGWW